MKSDEAGDLRHGRDDRLVVWQIGSMDEDAMDRTLPVDATNDTSPKSPWILHMLTVNTLNFCSFAMCYEEMPQNSSDAMTVRDKYAHKPILIAVPNTVDSGCV